MFKRFRIAHVVRGGIVDAAERNGSLSAPSAAGSWSISLGRGVATAGSRGQQPGRQVSSLAVDRRGVEESFSDGLVPPWNTALKALAFP
jgi:hypothetical protein